MKKDFKMFLPSDFTDGKDLFPLVMVGKVLEANNRWDIGKEVIDCVNKTYRGAYPIHPKVNRTISTLFFRP